MSSAHAPLPEYRVYGSTALRRSRDGAAALTGCIVALGAVGIFMVTAGKTILPTPSAPPAMMIMRIMEEFEPVPPPVPVEETPHKIVAEDSEFDIPLPPEPLPEPVPPEPKPEPVPAPKPEPKPGPKRRPRQETSHPEHTRPSAPAKDAPRESAVPAAPAGEVSGSTADAAAVVERKAEGELRDKLLARLIAEIEKRKNYPRQARRTGAEGTCTLEIRVNASGVVQSCGVAKGSGSSVLDAATSRLSGKLAGFDTGVKGKALRVLVPVRYSLRDK